MLIYEKKCLLEIILINCQDGGRISIIHSFSHHWSFVYIRKTYVDQSPKPQNVQILKMHAFSVKCAHFHLICIKCTHFPENACILCKLQGVKHSYFSYFFLFFSLNSFFSNFSYFSALIPIFPIFFRF